MAEHSRQSGQKAVDAAMIAPAAGFADDGGPPSPRDSRTVSSAGSTDPRADPFWMTTPLETMSGEQWESLCDGCGKCCLEKLEDVRSGEVSYTNVACQLLDLGSCRCSRYAERRHHVPNCERLTAENVRRFRWLPSSCAYRLLAEGAPLPLWHPLVSGDPEAVHRAGASVRGRAIPHRRTRHLEHHIVSWPA